jgi:hypothetical protein
LFLPLIFSSWELCKLLCWAFVLLSGIAQALLSFLLHSQDSLLLLCFWLELGIDFSGFCCFHFLLVFSPSASWEYFEGFVHYILLLVHLDDGDLLIGEVGWVDTLELVCIA